MRAPGVVERIVRFNHGREPERVHLKYAAMRKSPFAFFRGSSHLFFEDLPPHARRSSAPLGWVTGDLHLENFGTYLGGNALVYFDLNDFDEAALAPVDWDLRRLVTSALLASNGLVRSPSDSRRAAEAVLEGYRRTLATGKPGWCERATTTGQVRRLIRQVGRRKEGNLMHRWTRRGYRFSANGDRSLPATAADRARVARAVSQLLVGLPDGGSLRVRDVARRVAGTGSLGLRRYVVLLAGRGPAPVLLDLKEARPSSLAPYLATEQPRWHNDGERVISIQGWVQAVAPAHLQTLRIGRRDFVARQLQPAEDRLSFSKARAWRPRYAPTLRTLGAVVAWSHLRAGGRGGAANADEWMAFAREGGWTVELLRFAERYAGQVQADWQEFRRSGLGRKHV